MQNSNNNIVEHKTLMIHLHMKYVTKHKGVSIKKNLSIFISRKISILLCLHNNKSMTYDKSLNKIIGKLFLYLLLFLQLASP